MDPIVFEETDGEVYDTGVVRLRLLAQLPDQPIAVADNTVPPGVPGPVVPLPALPVPPAPPVWARTNVALMQRTVKARMNIFAEVRYIAWLLDVFEGE